MPQFTFTDSVSSLSKTVTYQTSPSPDGAQFKDPSVPAGIAGTLTTRSSGTAGVVTVASHSISGTAFVMWTISGVNYAAHFTVSSTTGTTITLASGVGDALPVQDSAVVISGVTTESLDLSSVPNAIGVSNLSSSAACFAFADGGTLTSAVFKMPFVWHDEQPQANGSNLITTIPSDEIRIGNGTTAAITGQILIGKS